MGRLLGTLLKKNHFRPTDPNFFQHVTVNTHIFFLAKLHQTLRIIDENFYLV